MEERGVSIDQGLDALRLAAAQDICHPEELCDRLVDAMLAIHPANDDIAVLALRALPTAPPPLHLDIPSDPSQLGAMRRELGTWLRAAGASGEVVEVVQMACHEACSNSIEHGYSFGEGSLSVDAELDASQVILTIRDDGGWVERPNGNLPYRGNGLPLMEALMDSVELTHGNGAGTAVRMARCSRPTECRPRPERRGGGRNSSGEGSIAKRPDFPADTGVTRRSPFSAVVRLPNLNLACSSTASSGSVTPAFGSRSGARSCTSTRTACPRTRRRPT